MADSDDDGFIQKKDQPTERQYAAIGRVVATWSEVEFALESILSRLALTPALLGFVLTDKLGPDNRIGAIKSLIHVHQTKYAGVLVDQGALAQISGLLKTVRKMKDDRNFIAHTVWSRATDDFMSHFDATEAARSGQDFSAGPAERLADIEAFGAEVRKLADRLWHLGRLIPGPDAALLNKLHAQEHQSRRRPPDQSTRQYQRRSYGGLPEDDDDGPPQE